MKPNNPVRAAFGADDGLTLAPGGGYMPIKHREIVAGGQHVHGGVGQKR